MADLFIISNDIVRPVNFNESNRIKIDLTPWDVSFLLAEYPQRCLLFPKPNSKFDVIDHLKSSLSAALDVFYPFAGRLATIQNDDKTNSFFINCDGSGVKFVHAVAKTTAVDDVVDPEGYVPGFIGSFFPMNGVKSYEGTTESLLAVQVTELVDGILIGLGFNHMVADGSSFWRFVKIWSEISSRSSKVLFQPLVLEGWFLNGIDYPIRVPFSNPNTVMHESLPLPILQDVVFHFTREDILELKSKANNEITIDGQISSLQAFVAHLWRSITRQRGLHPHQETSCKLLVDMRQRLNPPLRPEFFGNVVCFGTVKSTASEILGQGLGWAASQINRMVGSQTDREARKFLEDWVKDPKIPNLGVRSTAAGNSVIVSGSPRFNVYGNDFGWGKPIAVRAGPGNCTDGKLVVYPGTEEGSVDIQACLSPDTIKGLLADSEFLASFADV